MYKNNEPEEHFQMINFSRQCQNWGLRGSIMIHLHKDKLFNFVKDLIENKVLNSFELSIRPFMESYPIGCMTLESRNLCYPEIDNILKVLLDYLFKNNIKIVWKEGEFGYEIDNEGTVLKKWGLDDGGC